MLLNVKKIGLIVCMGVVVGNMMGSGIVLFFFMFVSVGLIFIYSWLICIVGVFSLVFVFVCLVIKNL